MVIRKGPKQATNVIRQMKTRHNLYVCVTTVEDKTYLLETSCCIVSIWTVMFNVYSNAFIANPDYVIYEDGL